MIVAHDDCASITLNGGDGLESVGFEFVLGNELSPMAAETFAYNFFNEIIGLF